MVELQQGEIWWADLADPRGSAPGFRRPVIIIQGDHLNRSRIASVVCIPLTSNLKWASAPGNVYLDSTMTGLPKDSVANVSQVITIDKADLDQRTGKLTPALFSRVLQGVDIVLGR